MPPPQHTDNQAIKYPLAVVIPAYKAEFLSETLKSIREQKSKYFRVYVGDDGSPHDLESICSEFSSDLDLEYVRFAENLGQVSLVAHWNRCVRLSAEPWVWLFGDDDIMEPGCIDRLLQAISEEGERFDLFHFDVTTIDARGQVLWEGRPFPERMSAQEFALARLRRELGSYAPDYIFSRAAFDRIGGFVDFPLAWCSDDATWIAVAGAKGIRTLDGPRVRWRLSGQNISSRSPATSLRKIDAATQYLVWLYEQLGAIPPHAGGPSIDEIMQYTPSWLYHQMRHLRGRFWPRLGWLVSWRLRHLPYHGLLRNILRTLRFDLLSGRRNDSLGP